ncbi:MAG TPA: hypothetical protein VJV78_09950, partial [Polyangiales bacterium]|nr:hypothetical protein [Polyangiales bacterium]
FVPNLIKFVADGKKSLPEFYNLMQSNLLSLAFTFGCLVPSVMVLLSLLPNEDDVSSSARPDVRVRLSRFTAYWARAWMLSIAGLGCMAVATAVRSDPMPDELRQALFVLAMLLKTAAAYSVLATFFCIARFSRDPGASPSYSIPPRVTAVFVLLAIAVGTFVLVGKGDDPAAQAGRAINSAISGVALCLLVGRLDSHLIGVPGAIMALLYLNAVAHAVCGFATNNISAGILIARLPLDVLLMAVVAWAIQGRALERYLTYVAEVSGLVPRDTRRRDV